VSVGQWNADFISAAGHRHMRIAKGSSPRRQEFGLEYLGITAEFSDLASWFEM
jgi:hypothetical protein